VVEVDIEWSCRVCEPKYYRRAIAYPHWFINSIEDSDGWLRFGLNVTEVGRGQRLL
jgi:hypothetical protein